MFTAYIVQHWFVISSRMDDTASSEDALWKIPYCASSAHLQPCSSSPSSSALVSGKRICYNDYVQGEFPLLANPSIVLHVLSECNLNPEDLARLEASLHNKSKTNTKQTKRRRH